MKRESGRTSIDQVEVVDDFASQATGVGAPVSSEKDVRELDGIRRLLSHLHGEITELSLSYKEVLRVLQRFEELCTRDQMTHLLNREAFFRKWTDLLMECIGAEEAVAVLAIDIDHFKRINDSYGHAVGDEVIQRVAGILREFESQFRFASRFGGEEFIVGMKAGQLTEALDFAEKLRSQVEQTQCSSPSCTVSIGVSVVSSRECPSEGAPGLAREVAEKMIHQADAALYRAKKEGRNRVRAA